MVVAYLMKIKNMSFDEALQFVSKKRPVTNPNASFRRQLQEYGQKLRRAATTSKGKSAIGAAVRGPQGPSLQPSSDSNRTKVATSPTTKTMKASIGPQLPPHLQMTAEEESKEENATATEDVDEPVVVIGPSFPSFRKRHRGEESNEAAGVPQKNESIGPQLPPNLQRKVEERTVVAEDVVECVVIGSSFSPSHKRHRSQEDNAADILPSSESHVKRVKEE